MPGDAADGLIVRLAQRQDSFPKLLPERCSGLFTPDIDGRNRMSAVFKAKERKHGYS